MAPADVEQEELRDEEEVWEEALTNACSPTNLGMVLHQKDLELNAITARSQAIQ
jgi:hypothetical protein